MGLGELRCLGFLRCFRCDATDPRDLLVPREARFFAFLNNSTAL